MVSTIKSTPAGKRLDTRRHDPGVSYGRRWRKASKSFLAYYPLCSLCMCRGVLSPGTLVDHIAPHRGKSEQFWCQDNWQPLCKRCHDSDKHKHELAGKSEADWLRYLLDEHARCGKPTLSLSLLPPRIADTLA